MSIHLDKQLQFSNLSYKTTEQNLFHYFSNYGSIEKLILYKDDQDQSLRKGFLIYKNSNSINDVMSKRPHFIDNRQIFLQRTMPMNHYNNSNYLSESLGIQLTVKEVFISRLCSGETKEMFMNYFQRFGTILDCRVFNSYSLNPKQMGYAFLRFDDYDSVGKKIYFNYRI
jgi:RNA recognition motif-containing protein